MAEARYTTTARIPVETLWHFVGEMDNFAPFFMGYQEHVKESETDSRWVLKGDLGAMTRRLEFRVRITEWTPHERVRFEVQGLNEPMAGTGSFAVQRWEEADAAAAQAGTPPPEARRGAPARLLERVFGFFFRLVRGRPRRAEGADAGPGAGMTRIVFHLEVRPGGPMAPMIDAMIQPLMPSFAEDFAGKLVAHLEARGAGPADRPLGES